MTQALAIALAQFTGDPNHTGDQLVGKRSCPVVIASGRQQQHTWAQRGYTRTYHFVALPSSSDPRWLVPLGGENRIKPGLQIYTPYTRLGRGLKAFTMGMLKAGWKGWLSDRILVASREPLPLEKLVTEVTGERRPAFALSLGQEGRFRKLTALVMQPNGEVLGYIKLPLNEAAGERIRHEAAVLEDLRKFPALRSHLPRVLHASAWGSGYVLFQSAGPEAPGETEFGEAHHQFLGKLWDVRRTDLPGQALLDRTAERWNALRQQMGAQLFDMGGEALRRAAITLNGHSLPCGIMHGDFAPWNTRRGDARLFVYDWEAAEWDAPFGWDIFHFEIQVASLLNRRTRKDLPGENGALQRESFWLYLLSSICAGLEEESPVYPGVDYRKQILARELARAAESHN